MLSRTRMSCAVVAPLGLPGPVESNGRSWPALSRSARVAGRARSQTTVPRARMAERLVGANTAPPPTLTTSSGPISPTSAIARASATRKPASPSSLKISATVRPARPSTSWSVSTAPRPSMPPKSPATVDFPVPMMPTSTTLRSGGGPAAGGVKPLGRRGSRRGCARARPSSPRRTCAPPGPPAPTPSWSRLLRPWPVRRCGQCVP